MKKCVLISGPTIAEDKILIGEIQKFASVLICPDCRKIENILARKSVHLILYEIDRYDEVAMKILKNIERQFADAKIFLIDGNRDLIAYGFKIGADDAFRKPYLRDLLVERVKAILRKL